MLYITKFRKYESEQNCNYTTSPAQTLFDFPKLLLEEFQLLCTLKTMRNCKTDKQKTHLICKSNV